MTRKNRTLPTNWEYYTCHYHTYTDTNTHSALRLPVLRSARVSDMVDGPSLIAAVKTAELTCAEELPSLMCCIIIMLFLEILVR